MKTLNLVIIVIFVLIGAFMLPTAYIMQKHSDSSDKQHRKESREKRMAYQSAHHSND